MNKFFNLKLKLKSGLLSELQSDTIWGHFCWRLKEIEGESVLNDFLDKYLDNNPVFTVSNGFPGNNDDIYFPYPIYPVNYGQNEKEKKQKLIDFLKHKSFKKIKSITFKELNYFLIGNIDKMRESIEERMIKEIKSPEFRKDLRVSVEIDRNKFSSKEGKLFPYASMYLSENDIINIFIKVLDEDSFEKYHCKNLLTEVFELGFGKKKSSGYGEFEVVSFSEFNEFTEPENANAFINLSNYLPADSDKLKDSYYDYHLKYGKLGEDFAVSENPFKKPIIFIKEGSCCKVSEAKDFYGRCTKQGEISFHKEVIQYGLSFSLNLLL